MKFRDGEEKKTKKLKWELLDPFNGISSRIRSRARKRKEKKRNETKAEECKNVGGGTDSGGLFVKLKSGLP